MECFRKQTIALRYGLLLLALSLFVLTIPQAKAGYAQSPPPNSHSYHPKTLSLHSERTKQRVNNYIRILEDADNRYTIEDIILADKENKFQDAPESNTLNIGYSQSAFWIALIVKNESRENKSEWWYQLDLPLLDQSEFYMLPIDKSAQNHITQKKMSYDTALKERDVSHVTQVYRFSLKQDEKAIIYLKIKSNFSIHLPLFIYTPEGFANSVAIEELFYGAFFGSILILIAYNLFMFISVGEKTFLYYISYMAAYLLFLVTERVHGLALFGEIPDFFHKTNLSTFIWIAWLFALILARSFLETKEHQPDLDAIIKLFIALASVSVIITPILNTTITIQWAVFCTVPYAILMAWVAYIAMVRGNPVAHFYFTAWSLNFGGVVIYAFTVTGYLPFNFVTSNSPHFGIICQMVIISFALADRIKVAQRRAAMATQQALVNLNRYRSLFDNAVEGIFQISLNREFIDVNRAMANMMGYNTPRQLVRHIHDALSICYPRSDDLNNVITMIEQGKDIHELEARYTGPDGETRWATSSIRIIFNHDHSPSHLEGTFIDITERVERVKDRLKKDVAEASAAAKSRFLANMSHEIRTPLTAIIGYGESLLDETLSDKEKRESSEIVIQSGKHLLELVNDILDHSKIDADKMMTEKLTIKLCPLLDEIKTYFAPKAAEKQIDFTIEYQFPLPEKIETDPTRFKQILINLCANALKFTESGSISLSVRCDYQEESLIINIIDTGIGVKKEQLDHLFDPFAQASPSIARQHGGTGLGLSISRKLAEMLGGTITALSTYGEGSQFEVSISTGSLKEIKKLSNKSDLVLQIRDLPITAVPSLKGKILYAEDNELNRQLVKQLVNKTGASITLVNNGAKALELVTRNDEDFDLILMDIQMPVMDGRGATKAIREAGINTPIIAITANVMEEDVTEYQEAGCTEFLPKPIEKATFYALLSRYLIAETPVNDPIKVPTKTSALIARSKIKENKFPPLSGSVLVAEDNVVNSRLISLYLTKIGVTIILAKNGLQAIQIATDNPIDLILMDQQMPEMGGCEAIKQLRKEGFDHPILAFTASDDLKDRTLMMNAGCNGIVEKPVNLDDLYQTLSQYLPTKQENQQSYHQDKKQEVSNKIKQFVQGLPQLTRAMEQAIKGHNWRRLQGLAHQISDAAEPLGFEEMTASAKRVESALKKKNIQSIHNLFCSYKKDAEEAKNVIQKI